MSTKKTAWTKRAFWVVVAAQALFLLSWAGYHEYQRSSPQTVLLEGAPVDPRDLLRGDYMILNFRISEYPLAGNRYKWLKEMDGKEVFVELMKRGKRYHEIVDIRPSEPDNGPGAIWVSARVKASSWDGGHVTLLYGIERFFVPEGTGTPRFDKMEVEATVSRSSKKLYVKNLWLDGVRFGEHLKPAE